MNLDSNFAVHVRSEEEHRAVQDKFFSMGIGWSTGINEYIAIFRFYGRSSAVGYRPRCRDGRGGLTHSPISHYEDQGFLIMSASEFLLQERQAMFLPPKEGR